MSIYMKIDGIKGDVTAKAFQNQIKINSIAWGLGRHAQTEIGQGNNNRTIGVPQFGDVIVNKSVDSASPLLFVRACDGPIKNDLIISVCKTADELTPFIEYILSDVILTSFNQGGATQGDDIAFQETLNFHYGKMLMRFTPTNAQHEAQTPITSGFNRMTYEVL